MLNKTENIVKIRFNRSMSRYLHSIVFSMTLVAAIFATHITHASTLTASSCGTEDGCNSACKTACITYKTNSEWKSYQYNSTFTDGVCTCNCNQLQTSSNTNINGICTCAYTAGTTSGTSTVAMSCDMTVTN